jgi:hypothetical protein
MDNRPDVQTVQTIVHGWIIRVVGNDVVVQRVNIHDERCSDTNILEEGSIK